MSTIAIQPDHYEHPSAIRWAEVLEAKGYGVRWVDVRRGDILGQLKGCRGFMWRWGQFGGMGRIARRLLPVLENDLGMLTYPDLRTCWHFDDKIAQSWLFQAHGIPTPDTHLFFDRQEAHAWAENASLPLVMKLASGAGSQNVRRVESRRDLHIWIERMFSYRQTSLEDWERTRLPLLQRLRKVGGILRGGRLPPILDNGYEEQSGYILLQEYLPDNPYTVRIVIIGKRAFGHLRKNLPGDFRAGDGSEKDGDPDHIDRDFIRLGYRTAQALGMQCCGMDGLYKGSERKVLEVSYAFPGYMTSKFPGHWELRGEAESGELMWVPGAMWPEQAQAEDFSERLRERES